MCPVSLVGQWQKEVETKLGGSLRVHVYHGTGRVKDPAKCEQALQHEPAVACGQQLSELRSCQSACSLCS